MMNKRLKCTTGIFLLALCLLLIGAEAEEVSSLYKARDVDSSWDAESAEIINLDEISTSLVTLTRAGDYVLSGTLNGQIRIETPKDSKVRLILNGATINSPQGPAVYEKQADKLIVTLADHTENTLKDGEMAVDGDDTIGAALYAEDDLSINGNGKLTVDGTQKHGIQSKADLIIASGNLIVHSIADGIRSRNSVLILDGDIQITAGGDGIVSTRNDTQNKGWIVLAGGKMDIRTGDGAGEVRVSANSKADWGMRGEGGFERGGWESAESAGSESGSGISQKAVKAAANLTVYGGEYSIDCADDALHGANVTVNGGNFRILSGDDGLHAELEMVVNDGEIDIAQCYEGLEGKNVTVNGGSIRIVASDDGVNAAGGNDGSGFGGRGWGGNVTITEDSGFVTVTGGRIAVNAGGDGLDSNGSIQVTGGAIGIWAATTKGEGAIDFNGTGALDGGFIMLASSGGLMSDTAGLSAETMISVPIGGALGAGTKITVTDDSGSNLGSFTPENGFDTLILAGEGIAVGHSITVLAGKDCLFSGVITDEMGELPVSDSFGGRNRGMRRW